MDSPLKLQIPVIETLEEHESNEEGENEIKNGRGLVLKAVIKGPISDQSMEQIVFDLPPSMSDVTEQPRGDLRNGERRYPPPMMDLGLFDPSVVFAMSFGHRFFRMENP